MFSLNRGHIDIRNIDTCISDVQRAQNLRFSTAPIPLKNLSERIAQAATQFPLRHTYTFVNPLINYCRNGRFHTFECATDALNCLFQHAESSKGPTKAIQELITSVEESMKNKLSTCDLQAKNPLTLHTWSQEKDPPYHWSADQLKKLGIMAPIIVMPSGNACGGLFNWTMCAYTVSGTPLLESFPKISIELTYDLHINLRKAGIRKSLIDYWFKGRIHELLTDILGVLNLGPAGASAFIVHCRAFDKKLLATGKKLGPTPTLFRALVACKVIKGMDFFMSHEWASMLKKEILHDYPQEILGRSQKTTYLPIKLGDHHYTFYEMNKCLKIIAETLTTTKLLFLDGYSLEDIRSWNAKDEKITYSLRGKLRRVMGNYLTDITNNKSGVHLIAAATLESLKRGADIQKIFKCTSALFETMNVFNPRPRRNTF